MPRHSYNFGDSTGGEPGEIKREFAKRLQAARIEKGFNQSELARAAAKYMADKKMGRDLIGPWERALKLPSPAHLSALARALGVTPQYLMPFQGVPGSTKNTTGIVPAEMKETGDGQAWIRVNKKVPWAVAVKVMDLIKSTSK